MSEQALNFIAMKDAARLAKAADKKAAKLKEEQEDDAADSPDPFEIGSVCYHGKGHNRRQVTILEVASAKPLKYRISGKQNRYSLHTNLEFYLTAADYKEEQARKEAAGAAQAAEKKAQEEAVEKARVERQAKAAAKAEAKRKREEAMAAAKRQREEEEAGKARKREEDQGDNDLSPPPPPPPRRSTKVPQGWKEATDATGEKYYYNRQLGVSQYELPHSDASPPPPPPPRRQSLASGAGSSSGAASSVLGGHSVGGCSSHGSLAFAGQFLAFQQQQHIAKLQAELQFFEKAEDKARVAGELAVLRMQAGFTFTTPQ